MRSTARQGLDRYVLGDSTGVKRAAAEATGGNAGCYSGRVLFPGQAPKELMRAIRGLTSESVAIRMTRSMDLA